MPVYYITIKIKSKLIYPLLPTMTYADLQVQRATSLVWNVTHTFKIGNLGELADE